MKIAKAILVLSIISFFYAPLLAVERTSEIAGSESSKSIRLASGEWSPYQSEHLKHYGVASRIVTEAFDLEGIHVTYGYFPWARSMEYAQTGEWDGTFLWFDTPERRNDFYISDPVVDIQYVFFYLKKTPFDWKNINDLKGMSIGGTLKYDYGEVFQEAEEKGVINVQRAPKDVLSFRKLLGGRIQIFPNDLDAGYELLRENFTPSQIEQFTYHPKALKSAPHHLLLSKKVKTNQTMIEIFNRHLKELKANGKVDQYLAESRQGKYKEPTK